MISCPQRLHLTGRFRTAVSGRSFSSFPFRQTGQITHPSLMFSLPQHTFDCNVFRPFLLNFKENILTPETEKNRKAYSLFRLRLVRRRFRAGSLGRRYLIQANSP